MIDDEKPEWRRRRRASFKDFSFIKSKYEQLYGEGRESAPVYLNQFSINMKSMSMARERERDSVFGKEGKSCKNNKNWNAGEKKERLKKRRNASGLWRMIYSATNLKPIKINVRLLRERKLDCTREIYIF